MGGLITMTIAAIAPSRVAAAVLNDIGPKIEVEGLKHIASYVGRGRPLASWAEATDMVRVAVGHAYPQLREDAAFWEAFVRRTYRAREDGMIEADYDPNIALTFADPETTPLPDLTPLFQAIAAKPVLSLRGGVSNILSLEGVARMRALKPDLITAEVANVGHAPCLDEPEAWDAILDFLARVD
jgi:pimeloyl-ACP methyl ester carboxylesterase